MNLESRYVSNNIVSQIAQICQRKKTGALVIIVDGKTVFLNVEDGRIVYLFFKGAKGAQAIQMVRDELSNQPTLQQFHFNEGPVAKIEMDLPPTEDILTQLDAAQSALGFANREDAVSGAPVIDDGAQQSGPPITQDFAQQIRAITLEIVGPMGSIICDDALGSSANPRAAVRAIIAELPDPETERHFQERINALFLSPSEQAPMQQVA